MASHHVPPKPHRFLVASCDLKFSWGTHAANSFPESLVLAGSSAIVSPDLILYYLRSFARYKLFRSGYGANDQRHFASDWTF